MADIKVVNYTLHSIQVRVFNGTNLVRLELYSPDVSDGRVNARITEEYMEVVMPGNVSQLYIVPRKE